jgi:hypothetical protein
MQGKMSIFSRGFIINLPMHPKIYVLAFLLAAIAMLHPACGPAGGPEKAAGETGGAPLQARMPGEGRPFQIPADTAAAYLAAWQSVAASIQTQVPASEGQYLVKGFHLPRFELDSLLAELGDSADVWVALAIGYDEKARKNTTKVVLAGKTGPASPDWLYYDFSDPCPDFCADSPFDK